MVSAKEFKNAVLITISLTYTFSDSVAKFGNRLQQGYLDEAYRRAGTNFTGQLSQHFVVLSDKNAGFQYSGAYSRKRGREEEDQNDFGYDRGHGRGGGSGNRGVWRGNRGKGPRYNKYNK